jgi:hypothetical protein
MFVPYSSDIYEEYPPWMGYLAFIIIILICFVRGAREDMPEIHEINFESGYINIDLGPVFLLYFLYSLMFLWVFGKNVCSKIGNFIYAVILIIAGGLYVVHLLTLHFLGLPEIWFLSWMISFVAGMYLVFWPSNTMDCIFIIPPWRTFSITGFWVVLFWLLFDAVFCILFRWSHAIFLHPVSFLIGVFVATILIRIRLAQIPRDESSLWDILFGRKAEEKAWKYSWKQRKSHDQQEQEKQEVIEEQLKKKLESSNPFSKSSSSEQDAIFLCDCGQVIILKESKTGQDIHCSSCGKKIHKSYRQK